MIKTEFTLNDFYSVLDERTNKQILITNMFGSFNFKTFGLLEKVEAWGMNEMNRVKLTLDNGTEIELQNDKIIDMNYNEFTLSRNNTNSILVAFEGQTMTIEFDAI